MTQEEYDREQAEIERLVNQINALIEENNRLADEINLGISNVNVLINNVGTLQRNVVPRVRGASGEIEINAEKTQQVRDALEELTNEYFTFKTMSSASKNLSQYTDEYYTRFSYYNNLRRITLGYVIGLDSNFVSGENMRKMVEKAYLQNTEYWLAYAAAAMMLWASNEQEAAKRAVDKALFMDSTKASLFFMLLNLRFSRTEVAQEWFIYYMNRIDASNLGDEWQYLLLTYLSGSFGANEQFQEAVSKQLKAMLAKAEATTVDFGKKFSDRSYRFAASYLHQTTKQFTYLKQYCGAYGEQLQMLNDAEKNTEIAAFYDRMSEEEDHSPEDLPQRIENVMYSLVNSYDDAEYEVVKKMKYNDAIMAAQGNVSKAQERYDQEFGGDQKKDFGDLLVDWAFCEDSNLTPLVIRKFAVSFMTDWIEKGYQRFAKDYREKESQSYSFEIDGCAFTATEDEFEKSKTTMENFYAKTNWKSILSDKFTLLYILLIVCGLATLGIMALHFSKVALTIGVLLVIAGAFLLWRRIVEVKQKREEEKRLSIQKIRHCLEELGQWRKAFHEADQRFTDIEKALEQFVRDFA